MPASNTNSNASVYYLVNALMNKKEGVTVEQMFSTPIAKNALQALDKSTQDQLIRAFYASQSNQEPVAGIPIADVPVVGATYLGDHNFLPRGERTRVFQTPSFSFTSVGIGNRTNYS
ncbi:MAG: hypothetical protein QNK11_03340 [Legionella sp.]|nr:hypothetical protein [Legionella sp.]